MKLILILIIIFCSAFLGYELGCYLTKNKINNYLLATLLTLDDEEEDDDKESYVNSLLNYVDNLKLNEDENEETPVDLSNVDFSELSTTSKDNHD